MTISFRTALGFALSTLVAGLVAGCAGGAADPAEAQVAADGSQAMTASAQSTDLGSVVFANVDVADPGAAAAELAVGAKLWPLGCVSRARDTADPAVVHVTFTDCTGPFGLVHIDGEEDVTLSAGANGALQAQIASVSPTANGKPISHSGTAEITFPSATTREVVWTGSYTRVDDLGDTVAHASDLEISADLVSGCNTASGSARTMVAAREVDTAVNQYKLCRDPTTGAVGCPSGSVVHTGKLSGRTVSIAFDDSDVAQVTGPRGDTFDENLVCTSIGR